MKRFVLHAIFSLLCCQPTFAASSGQDLLLFYSNDVQGETEPCGCQSNQLGGLSKKGFQFNKITRDAAKPSLKLDAGNLLFKKSTISSSQAEQEKLAAQAIAEAYGLSAYQAVAVGALDLSAGLDFLHELSIHAKFSWLSANLVETSTKKPIFQSSIRLQVGAVKATVIGLTGTTALPNDATASILPWKQVLPSLLDEATSNGDLVVLLSNQSSAENQRIAETYSSIHLIVQAQATEGRVSSEPVKANNTILVSTIAQGQQIGIMDINWQSSKRWGDPKAAVIAKKKAALDSLLWQLSKYQRDTNPEITLRDQPDQLNAYHLLLDREQTLRSEIKGLTDGEGVGETASSEPSSYRNRFVMIEDNLPGQPEIVALFEKLDSTINQLGQKKATTVALTDLSYVGSLACGPCHVDQMAAWQKTKHAGAYMTLADKKQQFNTNCLPCHVTGVSMEKADEALVVPEERRGVGCEACHGPGRDHVKNPKENPVVSNPEPALCRKCHAPPHDTTFDYERNSKMVH